MSQAPTDDKPTSAAQGYLFGFASLILVSFAAAASYFAYDCIGPLEPILQDKTQGLGLSAQDVSWLYSVYSIPVILFVLVGGVLADRLGAWKAGILFTLVFVAGTVLTALGDYSSMIVGRLLFGIGAEAFYVVMQKIIAKWFKNRLLALAFGLNLFLCRAGTLLAFWSLPLLARELGSWQTTLWVIAAICAFSLVAMVVYAFVDRYGDRHGLTAIEEASDEFKLGDVLRLPKAFWVISALCMVYYSAIFPFLGKATDFLLEHHYHVPDGATALVDVFSPWASEDASIMIWMSMLITWLFGLVVDRHGKRATMMIIGSLFLAPCYLLLGYVDVAPVLPLAVLGLSFSLVPAALWPALPLMVREKQLGTAYGVIAMVQNVGLFFFPLATGYIRDAAGSYQPAMLMYAGLGVVAVGLSVWLKVLERKEGSYLDRAPVAEEKSAA